MAWFILAIAVVTEIIWALSLKWAATKRLLKFANNLGVKISLLLFLLTSAKKKHQKVFAASAFMAIS